MKYCPAKVKICGWCAGLAHTNPGERCDQNPKCIHCDQDNNHASFNKDCPQFTKEKELAQIREDEKVPHWKAAEILQKRLGKSAKSTNYAKIVKASPTKEDGRGMAEQLIKENNDEWEKRLQENERKWEQKMMEMNNQHQQNMIQMTQMFQQQLSNQIQTVVSQIMQQVASGVLTEQQAGGLASAVQPSLPVTNQSFSFGDTGTTFMDTNQSYINSLKKMPNDWIREHGAHYEDLQRMMESSGGSIKRFGSPPPNKDDKPDKIQKSS